MKNTRDSYKWYRKKSPDPKQAVPVKIYCKIANDFNKFIMANVLIGKEVRLPAKMGTIGIKGKKQNYHTLQGEKVYGLLVDWKTTNDLWLKCAVCKEKKQLVYHLNEHTDGVRYKYFWSFSRVMLTNKTFYQLKFTRTNKRFIPKLVNSGKEYYVEPSKFN